MAGEWIKVEAATADKPEVLRMARILGIHHDAVFGKLVRLWAWMDTNSVDGVVDGVVDADIDRLCRCDGFTAACTAVGWLEYDAAAERVTLPNFERHNGETAKQRALKNRRQAKWRENVDVSVDEPPSTDASTREEKRREEKRRKELKAESSKAKACASASGSRLPADWSPPADLREWAKQERPEIDPDAEAAKFRDYWLAQAGAKGRKADWPATWRNWIRNAYGPRDGPPQAKPSAAADFRGKTYAPTDLSKLPPDLRAAAERALRDD